jgi:hypothetical protein
MLLFTIIIGSECLTLLILFVPYLFDLPAFRRAAFLKIFLAYVADICQNNCGIYCQFCVCFFLDGLAFGLINL